MFWFDKANPDVLFIDNRKMIEQVIWSNEKEVRKFKVQPDKVMDFRKLKLKNESFYLVVFDPPHLRRNGKTGWITKKYGTLDDCWHEDLRKGFYECFRVLKKNGVLIFKWSETDIPLSEVLKLTDQRPLFGHKSGKASKTHWVAFIK